MCQAGWSNCGQVRIVSFGSLQLNSARLLLLPRQQNACQINTASDPNNCGGCGVQCGGGVGVKSAYCSNSTCVVTCQPGKRVFCMLALVAVLPSAFAFASRLLAVLRPVRAVDAVRQAAAAGMPDLPRKPVSGRFFC